MIASHLILKWLHIVAMLYWLGGEWGVFQTSYHVTNPKLSYALVAGIFTRDFSAAHRLARDIDAGQVYINEYFAGGIEVPFGGNRGSGFGREKGLERLRSYCKLKSVAARL